MGQRLFRSPLVHTLSASGGPQAFEKKKRNFFAPHFPFGLDTYQMPEACTFTAGIDVNGVFKQVLKKSV